mmetsp:Transcript_81297/g.242251  ORF Transcript_81297/g.242251 Transcript_81297/m.242251 type:complete len:249 (+) Transcript_81297:729-1475(+)
MEVPLLLLPPLQLLPSRPLLSPPPRPEGATLLPFTAAPEGAAGRPGPQRCAARANSTKTVRSAASMAAQSNRDAGRRQWRAQAAQARWPKLPATSTARSTCAMSSWPFRIATEIAVSLSARKCSASACNPASTRKRLCTTSTCPAAEAAISGVTPSWVAWSIRTSRRRSSSAISEWPDMAAAKRGVAPVLVTWFTSASPQSNARTVSRWPCQAAMKRGALPSCIAAAGCAPRRSRTSTTSAWPWREAM